MIERSMMIHHHIEARDPGEAVRKAMGANGGAEGFARVLGEQGAFGSPDARLPQAGALVTPAAMGAGGVFGRTLGEKAASEPALAALTRIGAGAPDSVPSASPSSQRGETPENSGIPLKRNSRISLGGAALPLNGRGKSGGISLSAVSTGIPLRRSPGGIALDEHSLRTLSRVRDKVVAEKRTFEQGGLSARFESGGAGVGAVG